MNAQELIEQSNFTDNLSLFYPQIAEQKLADLNLTKCIRRLK